MIFILAYFLCCVKATSYHSMPLVLCIIMRVLLTTLFWRNILQFGNNCHLSVQVESWRCYKPDSCFSQSSYQCYRLCRLHQCGGGQSTHSLRGTCTGPPNKKYAQILFVILFGCIRHYRNNMHIILKEKKKLIPHFLMIRTDNPAVINVILFTHSKSPSLMSPANQGPP